MATLYKHPDYFYNYDRWRVAKDLYDGRREVITKGEYLWYHSIEAKDQNFDISKRLNQATASATNSGSAQLRAAREQRTRYLNLVEIIVSLWQSLFFKQPARTDEKLKELLKDHNGEQNIDGNKNSINAFLKDKVLPQILLYGKSIVLADAFPVVARNLTEQRNKKLRPFLSVISPLDNPDWSLKTDSPESIGEYNFFRHEFTGVVPRTSDESEPTLRKYSHTLKLAGGNYVVTERHVDLDGNLNIIKEHWNGDLKTENWQDGQTIETGYNKIPIAVVESSAWLDDVCQEGLRHYNIRSNRDNIIYNNGYDARYVKLEDPGDAKAVQALSEYTWILLPLSGEIGKLEQTDPAALEKSEKESVDYLFKVGLNKLRQISSDSKESPSAEAVDKDNEFTYALVEAELESIENSMNEAFSNYAMFMGKDNFDGKIELEKKVSSENFTKFISTWMAFKDSLLKVEGIEASVIKKVIKELRLDSEDEKKLLTLADKIQSEPIEKEEDDPVNSVING